MGGGKTGRVCSKNIHLLCAGDLWLAVEIGLRIQGRSGWTSKWQGKYRQGAKTVQRSSNKTSLMPEDLTSRRADNARTSLYTPRFSLKSDWAVKEKKKCWADVSFWILQTLLLFGSLKVADKRITRQHEDKNRGEEEERVADQSRPHLPFSIQKSCLRSRRCLQSHKMTFDEDTEGSWM